MRVGISHRLILAGMVVWGVMAGVHAAAWVNGGTRAAPSAMAASLREKGRTDAKASWVWLRYAGGAGPSSSVPGYRVRYPTGWSTRLWPDTLASYGLLQGRSPEGAVLDLMIVPLAGRAPALAAVMAHDARFLHSPHRQHVVLPLGRSLVVSGGAGAAASARMAAFLYVQRGRLLYRFSLSYQNGQTDGALLLDVARSLTVPAGPPGLATPPSVLPVEDVCCHCPPLGASWGRVLTRVDGVPVYSNAENVDNGCVGTYGILYQCVELVQRYFALRWGYPAVWYGVYGASDMVQHHPEGVDFIPNGGTPGPRPGDALVFYGGAVGHVALVTQVDAGAGVLGLAEENWSASGTAVLPLYGGTTIGVRTSPYGSYVVAGWLHSPANR